MSRLRFLRLTRHLFESLRGTEGSLAKRVVRSSIWLTLSHFGLNMLTLARSIILAYLLTPEIFGLMGICLVVVRGIELFTETGIGPALIYRQGDFDNARDTAFSMMIVRGLILTAIAAAIAPLAGAYYQEDALTQLIRVLSMTFILGGSSNINVIALQKKLDFKRLAILEQISSVAGFCVVVALAYSFRNVWSLVIAQVIETALKTVLSYALIPGRPQLRFDRRIAKELFLYGRFVTGLTIVVFITTELDNLVVGKVLGIETLGFYVLAYTVANIPATHIVKPAARVLFPAYSQLQSDFAKLRPAYLDALTVIGGVAVPAAIGLYVLADEIILVLYTKKWYPAVAALEVLAFFGAFRSIGALNGYVFNAIGKPNVTFWLNAVKLIVIVTVIVPLTRSFGLVGTSLAVTIPSAAEYLVALHVCSRLLHLPLRSIYAVLGGIIATSALMGGIVHLTKGLFPEVGVRHLILLILLGVVSYLTFNLRSILRLRAKLLHEFGARRQAAETTVD